jgi:excisionase family DNA binding protein
MNEEKQLPMSSFELLRIKQDIEAIRRDINSIKDAIVSNSIMGAPEWLSTEQLCEYLPDRPKINTVYHWVSKRLIPYHKGEKRLRFSRTEIDQWLAQGRKLTAREIAQIKQLV